MQKPVMIKLADGEVYTVGNVEVTDSRSENIHNGALILEGCFLHTRCRVIVGDTIRDWKSPQARLELTLRAISEAINRTEEIPSPKCDEDLEQDIFDDFVEHEGIDGLKRMAGSSIQIKYRKGMAAE